jgi:patatin-related protein
MSSAVDPGSIRYETLNEVRFAVVIYGGVSLAIYINGIAQEMLRLVRATAPAGPGNPRKPILDEPQFSEKIYRKLGQMLGDPDHGPDVLLGRLDLGEQLPIRTRFVIDILSGTSAGGINAIFLGKALANNQLLKGLENLWITQGDIESLINDRKSSTGGLSRQIPPRSLLNSNRMYRELLSALDSMDEQNPPTPGASLVDTLDLFCTATDINGLTAPLTLADGVVYEKRHRNVFHFLHSATDAPRISAFEHSDNPFLAFAARCTSAFPFAFEPMELGDIFEVLNSSKAHIGREYCSPDTDYWQKYYQDYVRSRQPSASHAFHFRPFGDGGYLDNKPFSYAIDTMLTRHADLPVQRKLVYIEPSPEELSADRSAGGRPNALENSFAALLVLPRYETIREDLERVVNRNLQIEKIARVIRSVQAILTAPESGAVPTQWLSGTPNEHGAGYATYERLKLSTVTDELADLLADAFAIDIRAAYGAAVRTLGSVWRDLEYPTNEDQRRFLLFFDVQYRLRRIRHMWRRIQAEYIQPRAPVADRPQYREELQRIKSKLGGPYGSLQRLIRKPVFDATETEQGIFTLAELSLIVEPPADLAVWPTLAGYAWSGERSDRGSRKRAEFVLQVRQRRVDVTALANILAGRFRPVMIAASEAALASFADDPSVTGPAKAARFFARREYEDFEKYDSAAFPITFGTDVDDSSPIDVHRISPDDAVARQDDVLRGRPKLRGQVLGAFGGFLDATWRRNDILWGRLDGAERIIGMLLPGPDKATAAMRRRLIDEAHQEIVVEVLDLPEIQRADWRRHLRDFVAQVPAEPAPELVARSAARATAVVGDLLEGIADTQSIPAKRLFGRVAFIGRLLWNFVEVSVPRTWLELFGSYWLQLLMLFSAMLALIAVFAQSGGTWKLAGLMITAATVLYLGRESLRRYLRGELVPPVPVIVVLTILVVVGLTALAAVAPLGVSSMVGAHGYLLDAVGDQWRRATASFETLPLLRWSRAFVIGSSVVASGSAFAAIGASRRAQRLRRPIKVVRKLKFARSWSDIIGAVGILDRGTRTAAVRALRADLVFASAYALLLLSIGITGISVPPDLHSHTLQLGTCVMLFGTAAAAMNIAGNNAVLDLLGRRPPEELTSPLPRHPFAYCVAKWAFVIVAGVCAIALWGIELYLGH